MPPTEGHPSRANRPCRCPGAGCRALIVPLLAVLPLVGGAGPVPADQPAPRTPGLVQADFLDGGALKLVLIDERIELETRYGRLLIPVADIRRIDLAWRLPDDVARRIDAAINDLYSMDFGRREAASAELEALGERAYPALVRVEKLEKEKEKGDPEVIRRAEELLAKVRDAVPPERLELRPHDVIHTEDCHFSGRIVTESLRVRTFQFGEQRLRLADVRCLAAPEAAEAERADVLPDPGTLERFQGQVGKAFVFRVTGAAVGGGIWGSGTYTVDSALAVAAVHAGVLRPGQSGLVRVTLVGQVPAFQNSVRNGVASEAFGPFPGYKIGR
jgi:hypothetical protein